MKRKASPQTTQRAEVEGEEKHGSESPASKKNKKRRTVEDEPATQLHTRILKQLQRLGCKIRSKEGERREKGKEKQKTNNNSATSTTSTSTSTTSTSSFSTADAEPTKIGGKELPGPLLQWMTEIEWPHVVMKNKERDLINIDLHCGWELKGDAACPERPCLEIGAAYHAESNAAIFLAIPLDCADPSLPEIIIKHIDGSDGPLVPDEEGIPLIEFLAELKSDSFQHGDVPENTTTAAATNSVYSSFLQALNTGDALPSDDEDGEHEDDDDDAGEEDYEWSEKLSEDDDEDEEEDGEDDGEDDGEEEEEEEEEDDEEEEEEEETD